MSKIKLGVAGFVTLLVVQGFGCDSVYDEAYRPIAECGSEEYPPCAICECVAGLEPAGDLVCDKNDNPGTCNDCTCVDGKPVCHGFLVENASCADISDVGEIIGR